MKHPSTTIPSSTIAIEESSPVESSRVQADDELAGAQFGLLLQVSWPIFRSWCVSEFNSIGPNYSFRFPVSSPELACLPCHLAYLSCGDGDELHQIRSDQIGLGWVRLDASFVISSRRALWYSSLISAFVPELRRHRIHCSPVVPSFDLTYPVGAARHGPMYARTYVSFFLFFSLSWVDGWMYVCLAINDQSISPSGFLKGYKQARYDGPWLSAGFDFDFDFSEALSIPFSAREAEYVHG